MKKKNSATSKKKINSPGIFIRYEFSDEAGRPEGGDILDFSSIDEIQEFAAEIIEVAQGDRVTVNLTIGSDKPFKGFLAAVGLSATDIEREMVTKSVKSKASSVKNKKKAPLKKVAASAKKK